MSFLGRYANVKKVMIFNKDIEKLMDHSVWEIGKDDVIQIQVNDSTSDSFFCLIVFNPDKKTDSICYMGIPFKVWVENTIKAMA